MRRNVDTNIFLNSFLLYILFKVTLLYLPPHYIFFMDYSVFNFGQLLFLLDNEGLKNNIRNIEKINKRIVHLKSGIHFNEICIQEGLQPNFTNIYIHIYCFFVQRQSRRLHRMTLFFTHLTVQSKGPNHP